MYFHVYLIYRFTRTFTDHSSVITRCWGFELQNGKSSLKSQQTLAAQDFAPASFLSTPDIKITTPAGCGYFYGNRGNLKCSAEVNSACAEVLPAAKRSHGAKAPPARRPVEWSFYTFSRFQNENFNRPFHVGAKSALLRRLFMPKAKKTSSARSLAPPFQTATALALGCVLGS